MDALLLVVPALGDFDLSVAAAVPVADDEVVAAAVITQDLAVLLIDLIVIAAGRRRCDAARCTATGGRPCWGRTIRWHWSPQRTACSRSPSAVRRSVADAAALIRGAAVAVRMSRSLTSATRRLFGGCRGGPTVEPPARPAEGGAVPRLVVEEGISSNAGSVPIFATSRRLDGRAGRGPELPWREELGVDVASSGSTAQRRHRGCRGADGFFGDDSRPRLRRIYRAPRPRGLAKIGR